MKTLSIRLDDDLDGALEVICAEQGRAKAEVVRGIVRQYVNSQQLKQAVNDPTLITLYDELAAEDVLLAEEGMAEYQQVLEAADRA